jgi:hypothetical protein
VQIISFLHSPVQLPAPDRQRREYKQVAIKGIVQLGPNPFQQIKRLSFFSLACMELFSFVQTLSSDYEVEFSVPEYWDRVVIFNSKTTKLKILLSGKNLSLASKT